MASPDSPPRLAEAARELRPAERIALVVLGMHRSGTSAATRVFSLLGAALPNELLPPAPNNNETGFWESAEIRDLHDDMLRELGSSWDDPMSLDRARLESPEVARYAARILEVVRRDFSASRFFVLKDPRICRFVPLWLRVLEHLPAVPHFVILVRNPLEVAASLGARDGFSPSKSLLLWLRHTLDAERDTRGFRRTFVSYETVLRDWRAAVGKMSRELGLVWPRRVAAVEAQIDSFLSARLRHHAAALDELDLRSDVSDWVKRAFHALVMAADGNQTDLSGPLDSVSSEFHQAELVFRPLLEEGSRTVAERVGHLRKHGADLATALDEATASRDAARREADSLKHRVEVYERQLDQRRSDVRHLGRELSRVRAELDELERRSEERDAAAERRERELLDDVAAWESRFHATHAELTALLGSRSVRVTEPVRVAKRELAELHRRLRSLARRRELRGGWRARRAIESSGLFDAPFYRSQLGAPSDADVDPIAHYVAVGADRGLDPHPLFDSSYYLETYAEVRESGANPFADFVENGVARGRDPNPFFDVSFYVERHPESAADGWDPLRHYLERGAALGFDPHPDFDTDFYVRQYPDVAASGMNPLHHYLRVGRDEARVPSAKSPEGYLPPPAVDRFEAWLAVNSWNERTADRLRERFREASDLPKISIVMPVYNPPVPFFRQALRSVVDQLHDDWELCIADDSSSDPAVSEVLAGLAADARVKIVRRPANGGIVEATNSAAALATGEFLLFLDHDDELTPDAVAEVALALAERPDADLFYSDGDKIDAYGRRYDAEFKPDWSPELLLSYMYCAHAFGIRRSVFQELGGLRRGFEGSQDHDLALRAADRLRGVVHVPKILYHWRALPGSTALSGSEKPYSFLAGLRAVQEALERRGSRGVASQPAWARRGGNAIFAHDFPDDGPSVAILVPTKNGLDLLRRCLSSLRQTTYRNYRVVVIDNESDDPETLAYLEELDHEVLRVANPPGGFNFSYLCNLAAGKVATDYVLFLNNDTEVVEPRWLSRMVGWAEMHGVAVVGALLRYPDGRIQHAGVVHGLHDGAVGHAFKLIGPGDVGYLAYAAVARNYAAVTAACMLTPRRLFLESGGFDQQAFPVAFNDPDYCYRLLARGHRVVYCPGAELLHREGASRGFGDRVHEVAEFRRRYEGWRDPFYNPNLSLDDERFAPEPRHVVLGRRRRVRAALVTHNLNLEGAPKIVFDAAVWLKGRGELDPVVVSPHDGPLRAEYEAKGIPVHVVSTPISDRGNGITLDVPIGRYESALREFGGILRSLDAEVVWANTILTFFTIDAAHELGLPSVWMIHESEGWRASFRPAAGAVRRRALDCFAHAYRVVFAANATRRVYEDLNSRHNFTVVHNGIDREAIERAKRATSRDEARRRLGLSAEDVVLLSIGTLCDRKNQIDLVRAVARMPAHEAAKVQVLFVGDRSFDYAKTVVQAISELPHGLQRRFRLVDPTPQTERFYRAADVLVLTSYVESYPRVILEAMAYELPIVTTPVYGVVEQVAGGQNASIVPPGDVAALADAISDLVRNPAKRRHYSAMSIPVLERRISLGEMCRRYGEFLQEAYFTSSPRR